MKSLRHFMGTVLIGGVLFLIPLVVVVIIFGKAFRIMKVVATPVSRLIPVDSVAGFAVVEIVTLTILMLACLLAGLLARSPWGRKLHSKLDSVLLQLIPGYAWMKGITGGVGDEEAGALLKPVLVKFDDQSQLAFEVDRAAAAPSAGPLCADKRKSSVPGSSGPPSVARTEWSSTSSPQRPARRADTRACANRTASRSSGRTRSASRRARANRASCAS